MAVFVATVSAACGVPESPAPRDSPSRLADSAAILDSLARAHPCAHLPYRVLFDSRYWRADQACGIANVAVERVATFPDTADALLNFAGVAESVVAVSVWRERICGVVIGGSRDTSSLARRHYAVELDVKNRDRLFTVRLDPVRLTAFVGAVHRGAFPVLSGPLLPPTEDPGVWSRDPCR
jgi:hypothetical protein